MDVELDSIAQKDAILTNFGDAVPSSSVDCDGVETKLSVGFTGGDSRVVVGSNLKTLVVGEKTAATQGSDDLGGNSKPKIVDVSREIKRVAEIVLVLSAMGRMRGGRAPTDGEKRIVGEARELLFAVCEEMAPKDIVPKDAVRLVIQDLGLNRPKDPRLSFRPPMMSIKEKLQLTKRKMEESQKFALQSGKHSPQLLQAGPSTKDESPSAFVRASQRFLPDTSGQVAVSTRGFTTPSSTFHTNGVQPTMISKGTLNSPLIRDASSIPFAHTEPVHFRLDGRPNVPAYASQVQANSSGGHLLGRTTVGAPQHQLGAVARVGLANKVPDPKIEEKPVVGASQMAPLNTRDPNQSITGTAFKIPEAVQQPLQGLNMSHDETAKLVQMFLHPSLPEHPSWTPPSSDYMHKTLTCQACKDPLNDVKSLLVCDACEKGTHIKCLPPYIQRGIPQADWHCSHCLLRNHGKPLPTRYGPVASINSIQLKAPSNATLAQCSADRKVESSDQKVNHQKATANGNLASLHDIHVGAATTDLEMS